MVVAYLNNSCTKFSFTCWYKIKEDDVIFKWFDRILVNVKWCSVPVKVRVSIVASPNNQNIDSKKNLFRFETKKALTA